MGDRIKGFLLAAAIGGPALAGVLAFFEYAGAHAWWLCWLAATFFVMGLQYIAPTWIMPLFNKYAKSDHPDTGQKVGEPQK